jgi:hypothetical protein
LRQRADGAIWGVAAPSANRFGRVSPTTAAHVQSELGNDLLILDGGPCSLGIESTIVDCTRGVPVLLRPGSINTEALAQACGQSVLSASEFVSAATRAAADGAGRDAGLAAANTALPPRRAPRARWNRTTRRAPGCGYLTPKRCRPPCRLGALILVRRKLQEFRVRLPPHYRWQARA